MQTISLTVRVPDSTPIDRFTDLAELIATAAHRCTDWCDEAEWDIHQTDGRTVRVTTPDPRTRRTAALRDALRGTE